MRVIGIDLGFKGAIATIDDDFVSIIDMPVQRIKVNKKERVKLDVERLCSWTLLELPHVDCVFIEKVHPVMAKFGASSGSSNFHLGYCLGVVETLLLQHCLYHGEVKFVFVSPQEWKKHFGVLKPKEFLKDWNAKAEAFEVAKRLFPDAILSTPRGRMLDGRSDALLIAEYGRHTFCRC